MPSISGIEIGPIVAATRSTTIFSTTPWPSVEIAIAMLTRTKVNVVTRAKVSSARADSSRTLRTITGAMSLVMTEEITLASEATMAMVCEKKPASTSPITPCGSRVWASRTYASSALARPGTMSGAANIGMNRISGQTSHSALDSSAERFAAEPEGEAM